MKIKLKWDGDRYTSKSFSIFECEDPSIPRVRCGSSTFKAYAILKFIFDGKKIKAELGSLCVDGDELDKSFLKLAYRVPSTNHVFWKKIIVMIDSGSSKDEIISYINAYVLSRELKK